ncbi:YbaN family protein [Bowmanella dokdonensis]|uniref:Inner membrane protein n=1 Tax=Bowmanella dokdonensis TaxID=751969 RepID=A0A939DL20_9ALTE|nr:YbaN family protein [Bowmanella dokdonensis]MBN7824262.1 YbaN family protein [Bowmanella dokdonensis]
MIWITTLLWRFLAATSLIIGLIGLVVPGLPTVVFVLLSAWFAGKGWPRLEAWLLEHPRYGPGIHDWRREGAIPRRAKYLASLMMTISLVTVWISSASLWLQLSLTFILPGVALWLWKRPENSHRS